MRAAILTLLAVPLLALPGGCDWPRDPEETLAHVRQGGMRVGITDSPPFAAWHSGQPRGVEVELIQALANDLRAEITWIPGGSQELLEKLERYEIDAVIGGITEKTPWSKRIGLSLYHLRVPGAEGKPQRHVLALPPGENGWIRYVDRFLYDHREMAARLFAQEQTP